MSNHSHTVYTSLAFALLIVLAVGANDTARSQSVGHPLDPLTWDEYWTIIEVLKERDHADKETKFWLVKLREPQKTDVLAWQSGDDIQRSAFAKSLNSPEIPKHCN